MPSAATNWGPREALPEPNDERPLSRGLVGLGVPIVVHEKDVCGQGSDRRARQEPARGIRPAWTK